MKKIIITLALIMGTLGFVTAQTAPAAVKETKQKKVKSSTVQTTTTPSNGMKKDGTPDMRLKANKTKVQSTTTTVQPAPAAQPATAVKTQAVTKPSQVHVQQSTQTTSTTAKTADKSIGTDSKGRTIYQGPKGGKYYINPNGNKEYVK
jgi:hypothetical protein